MMPTPDQPRPLIFEESFISVPASDAAQKAFQEWLRDEERKRSLNEVLAPFGLSLDHNVPRIELERIVFEGEPRVLRVGGRG